MGGYLIVVAAAMLTEVLPTEVETADIVVELGSEGTRVEASYHLARDAVSEDAVRFHLRRFEGQEIRFETAGYELHTSPGASYFDVDPGESTITVRYEIRGAPERIPLFVPGVPVRGGVEIHLRGELGERALRDGFPRLEQTAADTLTARPADLPSFVRLPPPRGRLTVHRISEAVVVLLAVFGTASWILRRRIGPMLR